MYDKYEVPNLVDMTVRDAYLAILFQQVFRKRQAEKVLLLRTLREAGLGNENDSFKWYTDYLEHVYSGKPLKTHTIDTKRAQEIMEEESKKAYIVSPVSYGLRIGRGKR